MKMQLMGHSFVHYSCISFILAIFLTNFFKMKYFLAFSAQIEDHNQTKIINGINEINYYHPLSVDDSYTCFENKFNKILIKCCILIK